ncbi:hypothetical protein JCM17478_24400 [Thermopirellula anaerolimosa]
MNGAEPSPRRAHRSYAQNTYCSRDAAYLDIGTGTRATTLSMQPRNVRPDGKSRLSAGQAHRELGFGKQFARAAIAAATRPRTSGAANRRPPHPESARRQA